MSWDGGQSGSGAVIVGFRNGDRIVRVSPDRRKMEMWIQHLSCTISFYYFKKYCFASFLVIPSLIQKTYPFFYP